MTASTLILFSLAGAPAYTLVAGITKASLDHFRPGWDDDNRLALAILWPVMVLFVAPMLISHASTRRLVARACPQLPPAKKVERDK